MVKFVVELIISPYTFFYYSANWQMFEKHMPPVQVYLDYFQALYPDLINSVAVANTTRYSQQSLSGIQFWPQRMEAMSNGTRYIFSQTAGLFARLESAGWPRRVLWTFLRDKVEQSGLAGEIEKEKFNAVMQMMTNHTIITEAEWRRPLNICSYLFHMCLFFLNTWTLPELKWGNSVPMSMSKVEVTNDSLDWLLQKGAFLIPADHNMNLKMSKLSMLPIWKVVKKPENLEEGLGAYWQIMGLA
jgi:hypothetical protein